MAKQVLFLVVMLLSLSIISASCEEGQIDVNEASATELDSLYGIGPAKAEAIISARPYENLDDLVNAYGIGPATLNNIKDQELACVDSEEKIDEKEGTTRVYPEESLTEILTEGKESSVQNEIVEVPKTIHAEVIDLNPKDIKTDSDIESSDKKIGLYSFVLFCVLLGVLFMLKKKRYKTEFEEP